MYIPGGRNRQHRILDFVSLDRGKRHYWGDVKGDYGFLQSADRNQLKRLRQTRYKFGHTRSHTVDMNPEENSYQQGYQLYHDLSQNFSMPIPETKKKNLQITNPIQIHLPAISAKKSVQQTQASNIDNYNSIKLSQRTVETSARRVRWQDQQQAQRQQRAKTEAAQYGQTLTPKHRIRYTPTFICSMSNPMPSYKLYPNQKRPYPYPLLSHK